MAGFLHGFLGLALLFGAAVPIQPAGAGDIREKASARLIGAGDLRAGAYHAGVLIDLAPETITYWRNPGDAGVPPSFDFGESQNARVSVAMPPPQRIKEADGEAFGYRKRVIFPLSVTPVDPGRPVKLVMKLNYAVCEKICIPMQAESTLMLAPGGSPGVDAAAVAQAEALLPIPVELDQAGALAETAAGKKDEKPSWIFTPKTVDAFDLFAEAPTGYFVETHRQANGAFRIVLVEKPKLPADQTPVPIRLTLVTATGAVEFSVNLAGGA